MKKAVKTYLIIGIAGIVGLGFLQTWRDIRPVPLLYQQAQQKGQALRLTDRSGYPLWVEYHTQWNDHDFLPLHQFPSFLVQALILSEDKNFYHHSGVDWAAKGKAIWQNLKARRVVRGASSLTEQVIHLLVPRPRTLWSKWLEGIEALWLERHFSKNDILECYLNQVPFASNRRGFSQAARHYFNRDLGLLTPHELLSLIILIKAPSTYDLRKNTQLVSSHIKTFKNRLVREGILTLQEGERITQKKILLEAPSKVTDASHFVTSIKKLYQNTLGYYTTSSVKTTLDVGVQNYIQRLLDQRLKTLSNRQVHNGAVLVADHTTGEIVAWVVGKPFSKEGMLSKHIDAVLALRQPGSTLKPFVYAAAFQKGWQAFTLIDDAPLVGAVGTGMHKFKNYSNIYYGPVTVREALANSLNVPAVKAIQFVGVEPFLKVLHQLGFKGLNRGSEVYEEGLALGNGEVSLFELVQAYVVLANRGKTRPLKPFYSPLETAETITVFPDTVTSLIGDILSDPWARHSEFGASSILTFPVQTAIKTGTSTDYRDAWIVGYDHKHVVGIWLGNLNNRPTDGVTGANGGALLLRSIFSYLNRDGKAVKLYQSPQLLQRDMRIDKKNGQEPIVQTELLLPLPEEQPPEIEIKIMQPTPLLRLAVDPRIPLGLQKFEFQLTGMGKADTVKWEIDQQENYYTHEPTFLWPLVKGKHTLKASLYQKGNLFCQPPAVTFYVK